MKEQRTIAALIAAREGVIRATTPALPVLWKSIGRAVFTSPRHPGFMQRFADQINCHAFVDVCFLLIEDVLHGWSWSLNSETKEFAMWRGKESKLTGKSDFHPALGMLDVILRILIEEEMANVKAINEDETIERLH